LNEIILRALAKSPDERFQTAAAFRRALESVRGDQPEVTRVAPHRAAPRMEAAAAPEPFIRPAKPHRGLYVMAGAALTIVILLAVGIQVANWRKTRAGGTPQVEPPPAAIQEPAQAPVPPPPAVPPATPQATPAQLAPAPAPVSAPPVQKPVVPQPPPPASQTKPAIPPQQAPAPPVERSLTAPAPKDSAASNELRDRMVFLAARAATVRNGLANLERQQARMGLGLRPDMAAANQRLDFLLKEAGGALASGDPDAAKRNADMAEREVEKLEKFLGK
jgi:serine/threonine-protein kinase